MSQVSKADSDMVVLNDFALVETILFDTTAFTQYRNCSIFNPTIVLILISKNFDYPFSIAQEHAMCNFDCKQTIGSFSY